MPSDPVTLNALRVHTPSITVSSGHGTYRPVTLDDFTQAFSGLSADEQVQVLEGMGAEREWICERGTGYYGPCEADTKTLIASDGEDMTEWYAHRHTPCGWRLVLPLPTPQEEKT